MGLAECTIGRPMSAHGLSRTLSYTSVGSLATLTERYLCFVNLDLDGTDGHRYTDRPLWRSFSLQVVEFTEW